jgi:hypothetical protein
MSKDKPLQLLKKLFKRKNKIVLIHKIKLAKGGGYIDEYHTEVNGYWVENSFSYAKEQAQLFYNKVVELNGKTESKQAIKTTII